MIIVILAVVILLFAIAVTASGWFLHRGFNFILILLIISALIVVLGPARLDLKRGIHP